MYCKVFHNEQVDIEENTALISESDFPRRPELQRNCKNQVVQGNQ